MSEVEDEKLTLPWKILIILLALYIGYMFYLATILTSYEKYCLNKRSKNTIGQIENFRTGKGDVSVIISYKFNNTTTVESNVEIIQSEENLSCYHEANVNFFLKKPYSCKGDTVTIIYDSLNYHNCYIVGMSKIPKPNEFYKDFLVWYERNFVPKEKWCVCEK